MSVDNLTESLTRDFGNRFTRRSLIGRVGGTLAVLGAGSLAGYVPVAEAASCCGCSVCGNSTSCGTGDCPTGTCGCGAWYTCECGPGRIKRFRDCCAACSGGSSCGSDGRPSCCYPVEWGSACNGWSTIKCRAIVCLNQPGC